MDFSIRTIQNYYKIIKSKRSFPPSSSIGKSSDSLLAKFSPEQTSDASQTKAFKTFKDHHLFKSIMVLPENQSKIIKRPTVTRLKTVQINYQPFSKSRDNKMLKTLCYKNQKTQRTLKNQQALKDFKHIGEISINNFEKNPENLIRINGGSESSTQTSFQKWKSTPKQRQRNSKSPFKNRLTVGKRAKKSPKKLSLSLRIRKTLGENSKLSKRLINLSTVESQRQEKEPKNRKSSITPWQIEEEGLY